MPVVSSAILFCGLVEGPARRSLLDPGFVLGFCVVYKHVDRMVIDSVTPGEEQ